MYDEIFVKLAEFLFFRTSRLSLNEKKQTLLYCVSTYFYSYNEKLVLAEKAGIKKAVTGAVSMGSFYIIMAGVEALAFWYVENVFYNIMNRDSLK